MKDIYLPVHSVRRQGGQPQHRCRASEASERARLPIPSKAEESATEKEYRISHEFFP